MKGLKLSRNIKKQFLNIGVWYNSDITVNNHYVFTEVWYQKGIRVFGYFLDKNGCFLKYYSFFLRFCLLQENVHVHIMQYNSVVTSITKYLRAMSIDRFLDTYMPFYYETLLCNDKCKKILYSVLNTNSNKPTTVLKWTSKLNCNFDIHDVLKYPLR